MRRSRRGCWPASTSVAIETERLRLRSWRDGDGVPYLAATNTRAVMRHLGGVSDGARIDETVRAMADFERRAGYCFWIVERRADGAILGFCGLEDVDLPTTPVDRQIEIGWRLSNAVWRQGYGREAAGASLDWAWHNLSVPRVVAFTVPANEPSWRLMERIGMRRRADLDFDHPQFAAGHPLCRHIVYEAVRP